MGPGDAALVLPFVLLGVIGGSLVLAESGGDQLRQAEGRFRALAATAHELEEFESGPGPR